MRKTVFGVHVQTQRPFSASFWARGWAPGTTSSADLGSGPSAPLPPGVLMVYLPPPRQSTAVKRHVRGWAPGRLGKGSNSLLELFWASPSRLGLLPFPSPHQIRSLGVPTFMFSPNPGAGPAHHHPLVEDWAQSTAWGTPLVPEGLRPLQWAQEERPQAGFL